MDTDDFLSSKYAQQLLRDADAIETELGQFNTRWGSFWRRNADHLGTVLISHLAIEHYIDDWLTAANPGLKPVGDTRLSFANKADLLDGVDASIQWLLPGVRRLNRIRNQLAHNLEAEVTEEDLAPIREIVWPWHSAAGKPCNGGITLVRDFALMVCGMLSSQANSIRRYGAGCGLVAYQRWLRDAMAARDDGKRVDA
jgi:hypothetical protein